MNLEKLVGVVVSVVSKDLALFWLLYEPRRCHLAVAVRG
jgi:hypothetical protein